MGTLIGHLENWKKVKIIYGINVIIMTFVIVYLGDHYLIDAIASIVVVISIYYLINAFSEKYVSKKKETDPPLF
ncbi:MAG: phosphatase PAP2 family protein, partial [Candidatus Methanofastidiosia archaeon]